MYFIQAQQRRNDWWRYILTILGVLCAQSIGSIPLLLYGFNGSLNFATLGISQNFGLILLLLPSAISFIVLWLMMVYLHKQKPENIISAAGKIRWGRIFTGAAFWLILLVIFELIAFKIHPDNYVFHFDAINFIPLIFIVLFLIPLQAGSEELLFRSYLAQGTGLLFRSRLAALLITSIGFGLMHSVNPEVSEFGFWSSMAYYIGFGIIACLLVIFDDGIELAIGVHTINNIYGCLFVTYDASVLQTSALWRMKSLDITLMNIGFGIMSVIFLISMSFLYRWKDWRKIYRPIIFNTNQ